MDTEDLRLRGVLGRFCNLNKRLAEGFANSRAQPQPGMQEFILLGNEKA